MNKAIAFTFASLVSIGSIAAASAQDALLSGLSNDTGMKRAVSTADVPALNPPSQSLLSAPVPAGLLAQGGADSFKPQAQVATAAPGSGFSPTAAGATELGQGMSVAAFGKAEGQPGGFSTASSDGNPFNTDGVRPMLGVAASAREEGGALGVDKSSAAGIRLGK